MRAKSNKNDKTLYCICRKPDDGSPMVQCDTCEEWFHCDCVNYDPDEDSEDEDWVCRTCEQTDAPKPDQTALPAQVSTSQDMTVDTPHTLRSSRNQAECLLPSCHSRTRVDSYCSDVCAQKDAARKTNEVTKDEDTEMAEATATARRNDQRQNVPQTEKPISPRKKPVLSPITGSGSSNGGSMPNSPTVEKGLSSGSNDESIRKNVVKNMTRVLKAVFEAALEKNAGLPLAGRSQPEKDDMTDIAQPSAEAMAEKLAESIEDAMFAHLSDAQPGKPRSCGTRYKDKFRSLRHNLTAKDNENFQLRVVTGELTADVLVQMSSEDMANPEQKSMYEVMRAEGIKSVLLAPRPILKKTHQGDIVVMTPSTDNGKRQASPPRFPPSPAKSLSEGEPMSVTTNDEATGMDATSRKSSTSGTPTTPTATGRNDSLDDILARIGVTNESHKRAGSKKRKITMDMEDVLGNDDTPLMPDDDDDYVPKSPGSMGEPLSALSADKTPVVWQGAILYQDENLYSKFTATARLIGGRALFTNEWASILSPGCVENGRVQPDRPPRCEVDGRVQPDKVKAHIERLISAGNDVSLLQIEASEDTRTLSIPVAQAQAQAQALACYFSLRDRYGAIKGKSDSIIRDFYLVPLKTAEPIPDFIYGMRGDIHETPRDRDLFLGIIVFKKAPVSPSPLI